MFSHERKDIHDPAANGDVTVRFDNIFSFEAERRQRLEELLKRVFATSFNNQGAAAK